MYHECLGMNFCYLLLALDKMDGSQSKVSNEREDYHLVHGAADVWILLRLSGKQGGVL